MSQSHFTRKQVHAFISESRWRKQVQALASCIQISCTYFLIQIMRCTYFLYLMHLLLLSGLWCTLKTSLCLGCYLLPILFSRNRGCARWCKHIMTLFVTKSAVDKISMLIYGWGEGKIRHSNAVLRLFWYIS